MPSNGRRLKLPVPVSVITGHLAAGKTTVIGSLLRRKPAGEHWAVLVNEFGLLGIDAALLEAGDESSTSAIPINGTGYTVKQLAGGCLCCTLSVALSAAIAQLVRQARPDRLLIEPSGLGHPTGLLDVLHSDNFQASLAVQAVLCVVDPVQVQREEWRSNDLVQSQLAVADVVVIGRGDVARPADLDAARGVVSSLHPAKERVIVASHGDVPLDVLLLDHVRGRSQGDRHERNAAHDAERDDAHGRSSRHSARPGPTGGVLRREPVRGHPSRMEGDTAGAVRSCGWTFHAGDEFDITRLSALLRALHASAQRVKGIFRTDTGFVQLSEGADRCLRLQPAPPRQASIVEVLCGLPLELTRAHTLPSPSCGTEGTVDDACTTLVSDWDALEQHLLDCLVPGSPAD